MRKLPSKSEVAEMEEMKSPQEMKSKKPGLLIIEAVSNKANEDEHEKEEHKFCPYCGSPKMSSED